MQYQKLLEILNENSMGNWSNLLKKQTPDFFNNINHSDFSKWLNVIHDLPFISASEFHLDLDLVHTNSCSHFICSCTSCFCTSINCNCCS